MASGTRKYHRMVWRTRYSGWSWRYYLNMVRARRAMPRPLHNDLPLSAVEARIRLSWWQRVVQWFKRRRVFA